jgi:hypothetical protein
LATSALAAALLVGGCSSTAGTPDAGDQAATGARQTTSFMAQHGLAGDAARAVEQLEQLDQAKRPRDLMASVRPGQLLLSDDDEQVALPMPTDRFYLSIAPYRDSTHECYFHSLTTCQGELAGEPVHVRVVDASGAVLVDKETATNPNGFVGVWLPKGSSGTVNVSTSQGSGSQPFSTGDDDATCMTTLRVA